MRCMQAAGLLERPRLIIGELDRLRHKQRLCYAVYDAISVTSSSLAPSAVSAVAAVVLCAGNAALPRERELMLRDPAPTCADRVVLLDVARLDVDFAEATDAEEALPFPLDTDDVAEAGFASLAVVWLLGREEASACALRSRTRRARSLTSVYRDISARPPSLSQRPL